MGFENIGTPLHCALSMYKMSINKYFALNKYGATCIGYLCAAHPENNGKNARCTISNNRISDHPTIRILNLSKTV